MKDGASGGLIFGTLAECQSLLGGDGACPTEAAPEMGPCGVLELRHLPPAAWDDVKTPVPRCYYRAEVAVGILRLVALLDMGATANAIAEEVEIDVIDRTLAERLAPKDRERPVLLERWQGTETVTGVAKGRTPG